MNQVDVCNLALSRIGHGASSAIVSLEDASEAARCCKRVFASTMQAVLEEFNWSWAKGVVALSLSTETVPGYTYVYAYPADCLTIRGISADGYNPTRSPRYKAPFEVVASSNGESRLIATDLQNAVAFVTRDIKNPAFATNLFCQALAWRLAKELALGLKANPQMAQSAEQEYLIAVSKAVSANELEQTPDTPEDPEDVRQYAGTSTTGWQSWQ